MQRVQGEGPTLYIRAVGDQRVARPLGRLLLAQNTACQLATFSSQALTLVWFGRSSSSGLCGVRKARRRRRRRYRARRLQVTLSSFYTGSLARKPPQTCLDCYFSLLVCVHASLFGGDTTTKNTRAGGRAVDRSSLRVAAWLMLPVAAVGRLAFNIQLRDEWDQKRRRQKTR